MAMHRSSSFKLSSEAQDDLIKIRHYTLSQWGSEQSKTYLLALQHIFELLSEAPKMGRKRADLADTVFSFPHASHVIYYEHQIECILVIAVLHKSRVPNVHLESRGVD